MPETELDQFLSLVQRVQSGTTARSENDLSARLAAVFRELGLYPVVDTRVTAGGRRRPDILGYVSEQDADLVLPAELVIESKRPDEVASHANLAEAMVSDEYWLTKTYPYLRASITRVQYFAFTTFTDFTVFALTDDLRKALLASFRENDESCLDLRRQILREARTFHLHEAEHQGPTSASGWVQWIRDHLRPQVLRPVPLSNTRNSIPIRNARDFEDLAAQLATFAAGLNDQHLRDAGLFHSIRRNLADRYNSLDPEIRRDLVIFTLTQHPSLDATRAEGQIRQNLSESLDEFVAASIHSLISRLFAVKAIEDAFCVGVAQPLIEPQHWLFATEGYDGLANEAIRTEVFRRIRGLRDSANPVVRKFAAYGFFFDWIEQYVDAVPFRSLFETLSVHDFTEVEGDLLGRFYENYAQQINRGRRRQLGQYYTPLPVVQYMWRRTADLVSERGALDRLTVLDPAMGSGTFLAEGARALAEKDTPRFWERLTGFDIAAQVLGIAHVNFYMAILSQVTQDHALDISDLKIYATDTLDPERGNSLRQVLPLVSDEGHRLFLEQRVEIGRNAKRQGNYLIVIGNPPYRNNSELVS